MYIVQLQRKKLSQIEEDLKNDLLCLREHMNFKKIGGILKSAHWISAYL